MLSGGSGGDALQAHVIWVKSSETRGGARVLRPASRPALVYVTDTLSRLHMLSLLPKFGARVVRGAVRRGSSPAPPQQLPRHVPATHSTTPASWSLLFRTIEQHTMGRLARLASSCGDAARRSCSPRFTLPASSTSSLCYLLHHSCQLGLAVQCMGYTRWLPG